jgi:hypothetical protein
MSAPPVAGRRSILGDVGRLWTNPRFRFWLTVGALAYLVLRWALLLTTPDPILGADARTYWAAPYTNPYPGPELGLPGAYLYPPPFIQALAPLRLLPWELFQAVWAALGFAALVFLVGPIGGGIAVTALPFVYRDLLVGNIHLMLGAAIVVGMRAPSAWVFPILTKVTPGIGAIWFAVRREWRRVLVVVIVTAAICGVSYVISPDLWRHWLERMRGDSGRAGDPYLAILAVRVAASAGLVVIGARTGRAWLVPIAVVVALPILWPDSLAILLACYPLIRGFSRSATSAA